MTWPWVVLILGVAAIFVAWMCIEAWIGKNGK